MIAGLLVTAAAVPVLGAANRALVDATHETTRFALLSRSATAGAQGRPLVALLGTSQTRRALDPAGVESALGRGFAYNFGLDGTHPAAYPYYVRKLLAGGPVEVVVLEIGWIGHDQYQGVRFVEGWVTDDEVRDAFASTRIGWSYMRLQRAGKRFPPAATGRRLRAWMDGRNRWEAVRREVLPHTRMRAWAPVEQVKDPARLRRALEDQFGSYPDTFEDAFVVDAYAASAAVVLRLCRERGVPVIAYVAPVNRGMAPNVPVLRHFERVVLTDLAPRLEAAGIPVLVPPDRFFAPGAFSDHVHLRATVAPEFSRWFGGALAEVLGRR